MEISDEIYSKFSFTFATDITNPKNAQYGFTHQYIQLYIQASAFPSSWRIKPTYNFFTNVTVDNPNIAFEKYFNWNILLSINGWKSSIIFPEGEEIQLHPQITNKNTISVTIPDILGPAEYYWNYVLLVSAFDFNNYNQTGKGFREHKRVKTQWEFGGGSDGDYDPNVVDILTLPNSARTSKNILYYYCNPSQNYTIIPPVSLMIPPYIMVPETAPNNGDPSEQYIDRQNGNQCGNSLLNRSPSSRYLYYSTLSSSTDRVEILLSIDPNLNDLGDDNHLNQYGIDVPILKLTIDLSSPSYFHFTIDDYSSPRFVSPLNLTVDTNNDKEPLYEWEYSTSPFGIIVRRKDTKEVIFNTSPLLLDDNSFSFRNLVFKEQYMEISTQIPSSADIYGLGERVDSLKLNRSKIYSIFNIDQGNPVFENLYGYHPFYLEMREKESHGVFINNIEGLDVLLTDSSASFRFVGGLIDIYVIPGSRMIEDSPKNNNNIHTNSNSDITEISLSKNVKEVIRSFHRLVGVPKLPPYWALGNHQARWGYSSVDVLENVVNQFHTNRLPLEAIWSDIDYMDDYRLFTLDEENFPLQELQSFVTNLHDHNQKYVMIVDPGIKVEENFPPYEEALALNLFIMNANNNEPSLGKVWPGPVHYIDFLHPGSQEFWQSQIHSFYEKINFDAIWLDMNEPTSFCDGHCEMNIDNTKEWTTKEYQFECECTPPNLIDPPTTSTQLLSNLTTLYIAKSSSFEYDNFYSINDFPAYKIGGINPDVSTISMTSIHYNNTKEYHVHNLYGHLEGKSTSISMETITNKRSFVLSRSTISSSGKYVAHWLGDNQSTWQDLIYSIPGSLSFNILGIPMVGADICGFNYNVTAELCARWYQLGSFYTFTRNHNTYFTIPQEPYAFNDSIVLSVARSSLLLRYSLLPYFYSLFFDIYISSGGVVLSPLFIEFPSDHFTRSIDLQFMIGPSLMFAPVVYPLPCSLPVYFPDEYWFDYFTGDLISSSSHFHSFDVDSINDFFLFIRGGSIIPTQPFPALLSPTDHLTTSISRRSPFNLLIALTPSNQSLDLPEEPYYYFYNYYDDDLGSSSKFLIAQGELYFDDGISLDYSAYSHWSIHANFNWHYNYGVVDISLDHFKFHDFNTKEVYWNNVTIYGVTSYPNLVKLNHTIDFKNFTYDISRKVLTIHNLNQPLTHSFTIYWGYTPPDQSAFEKFFIIITGILITLSLLSCFTILYYFGTQKLESFFFFGKFNNLSSDFDGELVYELEDFSVQN